MRGVIIIRNSDVASDTPVEIPVGFTKIWLMLMLMLICYKRKKDTVRSMKSTAAASRGHSDQDYR
jgi:hypothetical protein